MEVAKDLGGVLFLVDHEDSPVSPPADPAPKEPLGVPSIRDGEFLFYLCGSEIRFGLGVRREEEVIDTAGGDCKSRGGFLNVDASV